MSSTRAINKMIMGAAGFAAVGAASGAVGAKILADCGYAGYSVLEATRAGAAGNAVIGGGLGFLTGLFKKENDMKKEAAMGVIASVGLSTLGGMLGKVMLDALVEMPLDKMAAALATGGGAIAGGATALGIVAYCCFCALGGGAIVAAQDRPAFRV